VAAWAGSPRSKAVAAISGRNRLTSTQRRIGVLELRSTQCCTDQSVLAPRPLAPQEGTPWKTRVSRTPLGPRAEQ